MSDNPQRLSVIDGILLCPHGLNPTGCSICDRTESLEQQLAGLQAQLKAREQEIEQLKNQLEIHSHDYLITEELMADKIVIEKLGEALELIRSGQIGVYSQIAERALSQTSNRKEETMSEESIQEQIEEAKRKPYSYSVNDLDDIFTYHPPAEQWQITQYENIRKAAKEFAKIVILNSPACADRSVAIRKIREAVMDANAAIALKGKI